MMVRAAILCIAAVLTLTTRVVGRAATYNTLTNANGLSNSSVNCIRQDSTLLLWIGTWDGLNVYNGHDFRIYKFEPDNLNTISNNVIRNIVEQPGGIIWVSTDYGINRIDTRNDRVDRFFPGYQDKNPTAERVFSVTATVDGSVFCAATGWGLARYDPDLGRILALNIPDFNSSEIRNIYYGGAERLLLHTTRGEVVQMSYTHSERDGTEIGRKTVIHPPGTVQALFDCTTAIYMATSDGFIHRYDCLTGVSSPLFRLSVREQVRAITQNSTERLVIALVSGDVWEYDIEGQQFSPIPDLNGMNILSLYSGSQEILWVGTDGQGIVEVYDDAANFNKITGAQLFETGNHPIRSFYENSRGEMWVGTKGNGISCLRRNKTMGYNLQHREQPLLRNNFVYALAGGWNNDMFVGHDGAGLDVFSFSTGRVHAIEPATEAWFGSVYTICRDPIEDNKLWLGTNGYGLVGLQLDPIPEGGYRIVRQEMYINDMSDSTSLSNNNVFTIVAADPGKLWVGTRGGGLNLFDTRSGRFIRHTTKSEKNSISSNDILSLYVSRDSTLWIGTSYGLNKLSKDKHDQYVFERYTENDGLPNNTIHGIVEDGTANLWLSTNKGLAKLTPTSGAIVNYYNSEELQSNEFSDGAYFRDADSNIWLGGVVGINWFDPDNIYTRTYAPPVLINKFYIKQSRVHDFKADERVVLAHDENFFMIQFSALEFIRNNDCEYAYILRGFNDDWVNIGTDHTAVFTNVSPGNYEFLVKASNGDKIWSKRTTSMLIKVRRPWWNTTWAYAIWLALAMAALLTLWFIADNSARQKRKLLLESLCKKQQSDIYEEKLQFFTNVAHEFGSPLTLIYGSSELLLNNYRVSPEVAKHVRIMKNNVLRMQRLIGELMEFRKIDTKNFIPHYTMVGVSDIIDSITENFRQAYSQKNIVLRVNLPEGKVVAVSDENALEKIFYNLISNAYKYTPSGGEIIVELIREEGGLCLTVTNSGEGILPNDIDKVFNRFEILDNFERQAGQGQVMRNGIGLALARSLAYALTGDITVVSTPCEHTTFTLWLPEMSINLISLPKQKNAAPKITSDVEDDNDDVSMTTAKPPSGNGSVIMVVDDERYIRELIAEILADRYTVVQAEDGLHAIEILKHTRVDLILSDIIMPGLDGLGLLKYIKSNEITRHVPFVFFTYKNGVENEVQGYEMGGEAYIPKPFSPKYLEVVVKRLLASRTSLREYYNSTASSSELYNGRMVHADDKRFMIRLTDVIEKHMMNDNLSLSYLCEQMLVSQMSLYRKVKEIAGMTPSEYVRSVKLSHAVRLIRTTNMTVQEIMYCSGFNNKSHFYREFAKTYHVSPKTMREKGTSR